MEKDSRKKNRGGRPPTEKCEKSRILAAIAGCHGMKGVVAARLGVHRQTLNTYLKRDRQLMQAFEESVLEAHDVAESALMANIQAGNERAIEFYLERRMPEKYGRRPDAMIGVNVEGNITLEQMMRRAGESWEIGEGEGDE